jgi:hypothetical protein
MRTAYCASLFVLALTAAYDLQAQVCKPSVDVASNLIADVTLKVTAGDADEMARRTALGFPSAAAATVALVLDERVCARARDAYNTARPSTSAFIASSVYVVNAGSGKSAVYVVKAIAGDSSEFDRVNVFNTSFQRLGGYGG